MESLPKTRVLSIAVARMSTPKRHHPAYGHAVRVVQIELSSASACARNVPEGGMVPMGSIPRTGLSLETKKWDLFRMRRLDGISSCIIVIITGKLNRGCLLENCCCYLVIKMSRNTSSTGVLIDLLLGVEK